MSAPQMVLMSTNPCPNSGPDWIYGEDCSSPEASLTTFGYCQQCWLNDRVPIYWQQRVDEQMGVLHP